MAPSHAPDDSKTIIIPTLATDAKDAKTTSPRCRVSRIFKNVSTKASMVDDEMKRPLHLLDLPVDILKDIVKEASLPQAGRRAYE